MASPRPSVAFSVVVRAEYPNVPGMLGKITTAIGIAGGDLTSVDIVSTSRGRIIRDLSINTCGVVHGKAVLSHIRQVESVTVRKVSDSTFEFHVGGKIDMRSRRAVTTRDDMSRAYTPGVGRVCLAIRDQPEAVWSLTGKGTTVAVVTDGTAVLGLGDIGPEAAMPVMEGKALLFKELAGVSAWPICLNTKDVDAIVQTVKAIAPGFGGINLEDISAPRCFEIEDRLRAELDIPVFHDDQHGTAVVVLAGLINALKVTKKNPGDLKVVVIGVGAAGTACAKILVDYGVRQIVGVDRHGVLGRGRNYGGNAAKRWFADHTNPAGINGGLTEALTGADFMLGLAGPGLVTPAQVARMADDAIVFALSNPDPEIWPQEVPGNVRIMATGRTDYPNQINNSLCFPGFFRGVLDVRARTITAEMKMAAAVAIANVIPETHLSADLIIPTVFDPRVSRAVARAVARAAKETGVSRRGRRPILVDRPQRQIGGSG